MTKKRLFITVIFALLVVTLLIPAGVALAQGDDPATFRVREWGFYYYPAPGIYLGIPAQGLNSGTHVDIEVTGYGIPYGEVYPLSPILGLRFYEYFWDTGNKVTVNRNVLLGEKPENWATICFPVTDTMLASVEGDPYQLSIAWARDHGKKWWPIRGYYNAEYQNICIIDRDITGIYAVVDMAYYGYPWK